MQDTQHVADVRLAFAHMHAIGKLPVMPSLNWSRDVFAHIYKNDSVAFVQRLFYKLVKKKGKNDESVCNLWKELGVPLTPSICAAALDGSSLLLDTPFHAQLAVFAYLRGMLPTTELVAAFKTPKHVMAFENAYGEKGIMWQLYASGDSVPLSIHVSVYAVQQDRHAVSSYIFRTRPLE